MIAWASERSPTSPRTMARSVLPDEKISADSIGPVVWTIFSLTGALVEASLLASAATIRGASPSSDPTAIDNVTGRTNQRYAYRPAPAGTTATAATTAMRSQTGNLAEPTVILEGHP